MASGHHDWCERSLCEDSPDGVHLGTTITNEDDSLIMFLAQEPDDPPHLVVGVHDDGVVQVPMHELRGFLLSVAKLVGRLDWAPETQSRYEASLLAAYQGMSHTLGS
jgi:hypothetical protein